MLKVYKGAGIIFLYREKLPHGEIDVQIMLARRRINPDKGVYSIPGGAMSPGDNGDFVHTAVRETIEEGFGSDLIVEDRLQKLLLDSPSILSKRVLPIPLLFFQWKTFLVELPHKPENWPIKTRDYLHEFDDAKWFSVTRLPEKTHIGVKLALMKAGVMKIL